LNQTADYENERTLNSSAKTGVIGGKSLPRPPEFLRRQPCQRLARGAAINCFRLDESSQRRQRHARIKQRLRVRRIFRVLFPGERQHVRPQTLVAEQTGVRDFVRLGCRWTVHVRRD
jgi:hypothetical protein